MKMKPATATLSAAIALAVFSAQAGDVDLQGNLKVSSLVLGSYPRIL